MSSSEDDIEVIFEESNELSDEQKKQLEHKWPIFVKWTEEKIKWFSTVIRAPYYRLVEWDNRRRNALEKARDKRITNTTPEATVSKKFKRNSSANNDNLNPDSRSSTSSSTSTLENNVTRSNHNSEPDGSLLSLEQENEFRQECQDIGTNSDEIDSCDENLEPSEPLDNSSSETGIEVQVPVTNAGIASGIDDDELLDTREDGVQDEPDPVNNIDAVNEQVPNNEQLTSAQLCCVFTGANRHPMTLFTILHEIFPRGDWMLEPNEFATELKDRLKLNIRRNFKTFKLLLCVSCEVEGLSAEEKLSNLGSLTERTCVPMFLGNCNNVNMKNFFTATYGSKAWKSLKEYDIYEFDLGNVLSGEPTEVNSLQECRRRQLFITLKILAARVIEAEEENRNLKFEFINRTLWSNWIGYRLNHVEIEDAIDVVRSTKRDKIKILCENLFTEACDNPECSSIIHLDQLNLLHESKKSTNRRNKNPLNLHQIQTFGMGICVLPIYSRDNIQRVGFTDDEVDEYDELRNTLLGYRLSQRCFYVYVTIGMHQKHPKDAPKRLTKRIIASGNKAYFYVGRSKHPGLPSHHNDGRETNFGQLISRKKLNVFYMIRQIVCQTIKDSEKFEALFQLLILHIVEKGTCKNIAKANKRLEVSALDFFGHQDCEYLFTMFSQPNIQFLYNTRESVPPSLDFGFIKRPLILSEAECLCTQ